MVVDIGKAVNTLRQRQMLLQKVVDDDAAELSAYTARVRHAEQVQESLREQVCAGSVSVLLQVDLGSQRQRHEELFLLFTGNGAQCATRCRRPRAVRALTIVCV